MERNLLKIRLYSNRRLYDPSRSRYIKFEDLYDLLRSGIEFSVIDQTDGKDCTHRVVFDLLIMRECRLVAEDPQLFTKEFLELLIQLAHSDSSPLVAKFLDHAAGTLLNEATPTEVDTQASIASAFADD